MSNLGDSEFARLVVERKLCTSNELELVRAELNGADSTLADQLVQRGFVTKTQVERLTRSLDDDSLYRPAQQIPGFQILSKLGQGAMAVVFKAKQLSLDRTVAIKVLPKRLSENPEFVDRFYREGRAAARLNHTNIVQAFDVGESGGYHYFVMEYIDGKTVYDYLTDGKPMPEKQALEFMIQCSKALAHAHEQGLIHRDVKPKNIMITNAGEVKLADMGLAREVGDLATAAAEAGRAYGTPYYISPEQIRGEIHIDGRADIYALGATFYHMVTGRVPYDGNTPSAVMHKHLKEPLEPPDHVNHALSSGVGEIIEVMMAKKPEDRYPTCNEVIADMEAVINGEAPFQARTKYDHSLLETLATSGEVITTAGKGSRSAEQEGLVSTVWVIILGLLFGMSALINVILIASR
ncbi:MAG: serine/threonine protein kinase [Phycisphaerae bacterium]